LIFLHSSAPQTLKIEAKEERYCDDLGRLAQGGFHSTS
jgi:hypothetical protein